MPASIRQSIKAVAISMLLPSTSEKREISSCCCAGVTCSMLIFRNSQSSLIEPTVVGIVTTGVVGWGNPSGGIVSSTLVSDSWTFSGKLAKHSSHASTLIVKLFIILQVCDAPASISPVAEVELKPV